VAINNKSPWFFALLKRMTLRVYKRARLDLWFPHVPLAGAVGSAGLFVLLPTIRRFMGAYFHLQLNGLFDALHPLDANVSSLILRGVPDTVVGTLQIFIAIGLLLRSRIAWISALLITVTQAAVAVGYNIQTWHSLPVLYIAVVFATLCVSGQSFQRSSLAASSLFAVAATVLLLVYGIVGSLMLGEGFSPPIENLPQATYFTVVTMSTVGYGDILPKSDDARLFVMSLIIVGITVFVTSVSAIVGPIVQGRLSRIIEPHRKRMKRVNHYIVAGNSPLAHNTTRELLGRGQAVLVITDSEEDFGDAEVMRGDPTELDVLRRAGAETAHAVLALSQDDAENAFVILALRELNTDAKKVAQVNNRKNLERVRRVQPDMVLAPSVFGGEVLAMVLTEEKIDSNTLMEKLLDTGTKPA